MKKLLTLAFCFSFSLFAIFSVILPVFVFANEDGSTLRQGVIEKKQQRRENIMDKKTELKQRIATKSAQLKQDQIEKIKKVFTHNLERQLLAIERLDKIVEKLNRRIEKLKEKGVDTVGTVEKLASCSQVKTEALEAIQTSKADIAAIDPTSTSVREAVSKAVESMRTSKESIRKYHKCLVDVTKNLRANLPKEENEKE